MPPRILRRHQLLSVASVKHQQLSDGIEFIATGQHAAIRERSGLSRKDVARIIGVVTSTVTRWERSNAIPQSDLGRSYVRLVADLAWPTRRIAMLEDENEKLRQELALCRDYVTSLHDRPPCNQEEPAATLPAG